MRDAGPTSCPRCGYDLRGVVESWLHSCPLQGTCAECGLSFHWEEVLRPEYRKPRWCVEFVESRRAIPLACVKTFLWSFVPWKFWRDIEMAHRVRGKRLALYAMLLLLPFVATYVGVQSSLVIRVWSHFVQDIDRTLQQKPMMIQGSRDGIEFVRTFQETGALPARVAQGLGEAERSELRERLTQKGDQIIASFQETLAEWQALNDRSDLLRGNVFIAVAEAVFLPLARSSSIKRLDYSPGMLDYPEAASLWSRDGPFGSWRGFTFEPLAVSIAVAYALCFLIYFEIAMPVMMLLLPMSRRRARVRWRHIGRVFIYGLSLPSGLVLIGGVLFIIALWNRDVADLPVYLFPVIWPTAWILTAVFWRVAIARYLRMPHSIAIVLFFTLIAFLFAVATIHLLWAYAGIGLLD